MRVGGAGVAAAREIVSVIAQSGVVNTEPRITQARGDRRNPAARAILRVNVGTAARSRSKARNHRCGKDFGFRIWTCGSERPGKTAIRRRRLTTVCFATAEGVSVERG